jgi:hypothetical protein
MSATDPLDQLRKLAALKDEKILDEAEFNRLKAELLSRLTNNLPTVEANSLPVVSAPSVNTALSTADT